MKYYHERLQGWSEFTGLYRQWVRAAKDGAKFVEVGIWRGRSTIAMAEFIRESGKRIEFSAIDHFHGSAEHQEELARTGEQLLTQFEEHAKAAGVRHLIDLWVVPSCYVAEVTEDHSCDLVYLDASHDRESVSEDILAWWPKVKRGGFLAGHDWSVNWPGVVEAVTEFAHRERLKIIELGSTWRIDKP